MIGFLKSCYLGYFRCTKGNHPHYFGLDWLVPVSMEYEIVRVVSLSTTENIRDNTFKIRSSGSGYLKKIAKCIDSCQPAQSAQNDMNRCLLYIHEAFFSQSVADIAFKTVAEQCIFLLLCWRSKLLPHRSYF